MAPIISQSGWSLVWSGRKSIGPHGLIFSEVNPTSGPETRSGGNFDLQYIASGSGRSSWGRNPNYLCYWTYNYKFRVLRQLLVFSIIKTSREKIRQACLRTSAIACPQLWTPKPKDSTLLNTQVVEVREDGVLVNLWIWNSGRYGTVSVTPSTSHPGLVSGSGRRPGAYAYKLNRIIQLDRATRREMCA